jgi:hypothetical protein
MLSYREDATLFPVLLYPTHTCGRIAVDRLAVYRFTEYHFHYTERFVDGCRRTIRK